MVRHHTVVVAYDPIPELKISTAIKVVQEHVEPAKVNPFQLTFDYHFMKDEVARIERFRDTFLQYLSRSEHSQTLF